MRNRLAAPSLMAKCGFLAILLVAYHFLLRYRMLQHGLRLGAISYKLAPLYAYWRPHWKGWLVVPLVVLAAYFWWLRRTRLATSLTERAAAAAFTIWFLAIASAVAMLDGGPQALIRPLVERANLEYYGAVDRVQGVREFFREYPRLASTMPMHAQVHPPGAVLFAWSVTRILGGGPWAAAASIISFASLVVPLVYGWASRVGGPGVARRAAALATLTPSLVLFTATSMDGPFAVFLIATMWLFSEALQCPSPPTPLPSCGERGRREGASPVPPPRFNRSLIFGLLAGLAAGLAALMTYSVAVALLFCGIAACGTWLTRPERRPATIVAAAVAAAGFVGVHVLLWLSTGYDPIEMFRVAVANDSRIMTGAHHESRTRWAHLAIGNLIVFFFAAGLPSAVIWWPAMFRSLHDWMRGRNQRLEPGSGHGPRPLQLLVITAFLTLLIAASVPVYVLEVERVWMFLVPLVAIPVAGQLFKQECGTGRIHGSLAVASLLAVQTLLTEVLLTTYW